MAIRGAAMLLLFSVLLVFLMPAAVGPFSAVHGPVTALRANRIAQFFFFNLAIPARQLDLGLRQPLASADLHSGSFWVLRIENAAPVSSLRC